MKVLEGKLVATKGKFAIVGNVSTNYRFQKLISGAEDTLVRHGVDTDDITPVWVPYLRSWAGGAEAGAERCKYDAVICLGGYPRLDQPL